MIAIEGELHGVLSDGIHADCCGLFAQGLLHAVNGAPINLTVAGKKLSSMVLTEVSCISNGGHVVPRGTKSGTHAPVQVNETPVLMPLPST